MSKGFLTIYLLVVVVLIYFYLKYLFSDIHKFINNFFNNQKNFEKATNIFRTYWILTLAVVIYQIFFDNTKGILYFIVFETLVVWVIYYIGCRHFLKIINKFESIKNFNIKASKSVLLATAAWTAVSSYVSSIKISNSLNSIFLLLLKLITTFATLYFPIVDMYQYVIDEIKKEQKIEKEKMKFDQYNYF